MNGQLTVGTQGSWSQHVSVIFMYLNVLLSVCDVIDDTAYLLIDVN